MITIKTADNWWITISYQPFFLLQAQKFGENKNIWHFGNFAI